MSPRWVKKQYQKKIYKEQQKCKTKHKHKKHNHNTKGTFEVLHFTLTLFNQPQLPALQYIEPTKQVLCRQVYENINDKKHAKRKKQLKIQHLFSTKILYS